MGFALRLALLVFRFLFLDADICMACAAGTVTRNLGVDKAN
jgi:hypothetical protein